MRMKNTLAKTDLFLKEQRFAREDFHSDEWQPHKHHHHFERQGFMGKNQNKSGVEAFITGLVFTAAFGVAWYWTHQWFWVFPFIFAGILPLVKGVQQMIHERRLKKEAIINRESAARDADIFAEKEVLRIAKAEQGRVTPTMIALNSSLSMEDAEKHLEDLAKKGYATMQVTNNGRIEYEFPEFLPPSEEHPFLDK